MSGTTRETNVGRHENHQRLYPTMAAKQTEPIGKLPHPRQIQ
jgi:hypothetical protein